MVANSFNTCRPYAPMLDLTPHRHLPRNATRWVHSRTTHNVARRSTEERGTQSELGRRPNTFLQGVYGRKQTKKKDLSKSPLHAVIEQRNTKV